MIYEQKEQKIQKVCYEDGKVLCFMSLCLLKPQLIKMKILCLLALFSLTNI